MEITVREKEFLQQILSRELSILENNHKQAKKPDRAAYTYRVLLLTRLAEKLKLEPTLMDGVMNQREWFENRYGGGD